MGDLLSRHSYFPGTKTTLPDRIEMTVYEFEKRIGKMVIFNIIPALFTRPESSFSIF